MKRKILCVGKSSLAVSLPREFVELYDLKQGEEIDIKQQGSSLIIKAENTSSSTKIIDLHDFSVSEDPKKILDKIIGALFRQGMNSFTLKCNNETTRNMIREIINSGKLNMYEAASADSSLSITIRSSITHFDETELESMVESIIRQIYTTFDEFLALSEEKKIKWSRVEELVSRDKIVNDQTDICKRIINRNATSYKSTTTYSFVDKLEKIGDDVKYIMLYSEKNYSAIQKYSEMISCVKDMLFMLITAKNSFSIKKINLFFEKRNAVKSELTKCTDVQIYSHCTDIINLMADAYSEMMVKSL